MTASRPEKDSAGRLEEILMRQRSKAGATMMGSSIFRAMHQVLDADPKLSTTLYRWVWLTGPAVRGSWRRLQFRGLQLGSAPSSCCEVATQKTRSESLR